MFKINRFDDWISDNTSGTYGSGASEKVWLINPITGNRGLFKFPKIKSMAMLQESIVLRK